MFFPSCVVFEPIYGHSVSFSWTGLLSLYKLTQANIDGTALTFTDIRPPRPFDMLLSLKCIANAFFDAPEMRKKSTNISTYGMYPSFLHFLFVCILKESNLFSFWSNTPAFFDANVHCDASLASFWWTRLRSQPRVRHLWIRCMPLSITHIRSPYLGTCNYSIFLSRCFHRPIYF